MSSMTDKKEEFVHPSVLNREQSSNIAKQHSIVWAYSTADTLDSWVRGMARSRSSSLSRQIAEKVQELSELRDNWDGYNAKAIRAKALNDAVSVIKQLSTRQAFRDPFLIPTLDGSVQVEWHSDVKILELEATESGWSVTGTEIGVSGRRVYHDAQCQTDDLKSLEKYYAWFVDEETPWPL